MRPLPPRILLDGLLTVRDIAAALKVSVEHARDRIVHEAGANRRPLDEARGPPLESESQTGISGSQPLDLRSYLLAHLP